MINEEILLKILTNKLLAIIILNLPLILYTLTS